MNLLISLVVGLCAATFMHHWSSNVNRTAFGTEATWKLVWVFFFGFTAFTYGLIAL